MKFKELNVTNLGPIKTGKIKQHKINVFFGPNNSGKSIVSRLIHGINSTPPSSELIKHPIVSRFINQRNVKPRILTKKDIPKQLFMQSVLLNSGISSRNAVSYGQRKCSISVKFPTRTVDFVINKSQDKISEYSKLVYFIRWRKESKRVRDHNSMYIPAGRTGMIQFHHNIVQIRSRLLNDLMYTFGGRSALDGDKVTANDIRHFTRSLGSLPEYLEQFHDLLLSLQAESFNPNIQTMFSEILAGKIELVTNRDDLPKMMYRDPTGFRTELEYAGSGTVSAFPIVAGMHYVKSGGTMIVEEPEVHLEPKKQSKLVERLQYVSYNKKINLVFTTHSDYVVRKLLALVSQKKIKHTDLGMYYFNRTNNFTTIEQISIDQNGEAEQPIFQEAIDELIQDFSE